MAHCGGQIMTLIKITTRVPLRQKRPSDRRTRFASRTSMGPRRSLGLLPEPTLVPNYLHGSTTIRSLSATTSIWDHPFGCSTRAKLFF